MYQIKVADNASRLGGRYLEKIGNYRPGEKGYMTLDEERYAHWLAQGALPTPRVKKLFKDYKKTQN